MEITYVEKHYFKKIQKNCFHNFDQKHRAHKTMDYALVIRLDVIL